MNHRDFLAMALLALGFPCQWSAINYDGVIATVTIHHLDGEETHFETTLSWDFEADQKRLTEKLYAHIDNYQKSPTYSEKMLSYP